MTGPRKGVFQDEWDARTVERVARRRGRILLVMRARAIAVGVVLLVACTEPERQAPQPPAKLAGARVVDLIPASLSGETWQDAEPFLALYESNPKLMAASAFTPNPGGGPRAAAPLFRSNPWRDPPAVRHKPPHDGQDPHIS